MNISSSMRPSFLIVGIFSFLAYMGHADETVLDESVSDSLLEIDSELGGVTCDSESGSTEEPKVGSICYKWHVWRQDNECSPDDNYEVEDDDEAEVQRQCDNHETESYKYAKYRVTKGGTELVYEYGCSLCHRVGVHDDSGNQESPSNIDIDMFDLELNPNRNIHLPKTDGESSAVLLMTQWSSIRNAYDTVGTNTNLNSFLSDRTLTIGTASNVARKMPQLFGVLDDVQSEHDAVLDVVGTKAKHR